MSPPKITIVVPTYNRPHYLERSLRSILAQDFTDFQIIVLDNGSTEETTTLVRQLMSVDARVTHDRNEKNIGIIRNWNRIFTINRSEYLSIFHDDDIMLPGFLRETVNALEQNRSAGFVLVQAEFIDPDGNVTGTQDTGDLRAGLMSGLDLLELAVDGRHVGIYPTNIVFRSSAVNDAGGFDSPHTNCQFDLNLYNRVAAKHDVYVVPKVLAQYRVHRVSETARLKREANGTPWYGECAERIDAIADLLRSPRAADERYRAWLAERLLYLHAHQSAAIHPIVPSMYQDWETRVLLAKDTLRSTIPRGATFILVDDGQFGLHGEWDGRRVRPFLEHDGQYWGPPTDGTHAIDELSRMKSLGAQWIAFAWPCFWWLDQYWKLRVHLDEKFARRLNTPHFVVYQLT